MSKSIASGDLSRRPLATPRRSHNVHLLLAPPLGFRVPAPAASRCRDSRARAACSTSKSPCSAPMPRASSSRRAIATLTVVVPWLPRDLSEARARRSAALAHLRSDRAEQAIASSSRGTTRPWRCRGRGSFEPVAVVYDCMDELSLFRGAPRRDGRARARAHHARRCGVHRRHEPLRSEARAAARTCTAFRAASTPRTSARRARLSTDPADQADIPHLRLGFAGVIDERMDSSSSPRSPTRAPEWHLVLVGPVVKIDPAQLPQRRQHPLPRRQAVRGASRLPRRLGRRAAAVRAQRVDALHQPDQDAGISRRRAAGGVDADSRCRRSVRHRRARAHRTHARRTSSRRSRRSSCSSERRARQVAQARRWISLDDVVGPDARADERSHRAA